MKLINSTSLNTAKAILLLSLCLICQINSYRNSEYSLRRTVAKRLFNYEAAKAAEQIKVKEGFEFPCESTQPDAKENAVKQNTISYALLKAPNAMSKKLLKEAATKLFILYNTKFTVATLADPKVNRVIYGGVYQDNEGADTKTKITTALQNVIDEKGTPKENAGVLAILADIGSALVSYYKDRENKVLSTNNNIVNVVEEFSKLIGAESADAMYQRIGRVYDERGIKKIWPNKDKERTGAEIKGIPLTRSGIFNLGQPDLKATYTWETLLKTYFDISKCKTEPFTAHYSGTVFVTLIAFDLLMEKVEEFQTTSAIELSTSLSKNTEEKEKELVGHESRLCRAALAAAELLAIGYHSALEVKPVIWMYLGKNPPKTALVDPATTKCDEKSTEDITGIIASCTAKAKKRGIK